MGLDNLYPFLLSLFFNQVYALSLLFQGTKLLCESRMKILEFKCQTFIASDFSTLVSLMSSPIFSIPAKTIPGSSNLLSK